MLGHPDDVLTAGRRLGVPADQIGRTDHFFERGGTSLDAVELAVALDRAVSLEDITRYPVLADLATEIDDRTRPGHSASSQPSAEPKGTPAGAQGCFPYAGATR